MPSITSVGPLGSTDSAKARGAAPDAEVRFTGHLESITVPDHVVTAQITASGGEGSNNNIKKSEYGSGYGATVHGTLKVAPGDVLTVAVGGQGQAQDGNHRPGAGGWSLSPYGGGAGGSGHGSQVFDGAGGGGASVVQRNGTTVVVAAGGGGQGGAATHGGTYYLGGSGGGKAGVHGAGVAHSNGHGGDSDHQSLDKTGVSYNHWQLKGGGGGGAAAGTPARAAQQAAPVEAAAAAARRCTTR